jgi:hypothetical protein
MTAQSILHRFPLEIRELIYNYVLSDLHDFEYDIGTKPVALEYMREFERALIPDRQLYREVLSHRIRQSCLVMEPEWPEEPARLTIVSWAIDADVPLLYPSVEDMSPLARENIRKIEVKVPGYVRYFRFMFYWFPLCVVLSSVRTDIQDHQVCGNCRRLIWNTGILVTAIWRKEYSQFLRWLVRYSW